MASLAYTQTPSRSLAPEACRPAPRVPPGPWRPRLLEELEPPITRRLELCVGVLTYLSGSDPSIYMAIADPNIDVAEAVQLICTDPDLAARVLRVANSPAYGLVSRVGDLNRAVVLLGFTEVRNLALRAVLDHVLKAHAGRELAERLWKHSYACSIAAQDLATLTQKVRPRLAATLGLLHDLGRIATCVLDEALFLELETGDLRDDTPEWCRLEEVALGAQHAALGALIARRWGLPEELVKGLNIHNLGWYVPPEAIPPKWRATAALLYCAESLVRWVEEQPSGSGLERRAAKEWQPPEAYLRVLGESLTPERVASPEAIRHILRARRLAVAT